MLDISLLRNDPDLIRATLERRGMRLDLGALISMEERRRTLRAAADEVRSQQRQSGQAIAKLDGDEKQEAIAAAGRLSEEHKRMTAELEQLEEEFHELWIQVPNLVHESVPPGLTEDDAVELKRWSQPRDFEFEAKDHLDLGEALDVIDVEAAVRMSGSRFTYLKGQAVILELALVRWALDRLVAEGFQPVVPPVLVREQALFGTGFFPDDDEQVYAVEKDDLYLVGTSEVALASLHMDEILEADGLPVRYAGFSTCFRREAGTYGKDMRGIFRVHQFDKVEMFAFTEPEASWDEHDRLLGIEESLVQALEIPYRVVNVAAGDLGSSAAKKYDIEAWIPSHGRYRELTSCSNTTDFQSRRLKIRYRSGEGNRLVHTLNGTAVAVGRTMLAMMENHQQADGTVRIPEALQPYTGFPVMGR